MRNSRSKQGRLLFEFAVPKPPDPGKAPADQTDASGNGPWHLGLRRSRSQRQRCKAKERLILSQAPEYVEVGLSGNWSPVYPFWVCHRERQNHCVRARTDLGKASWTTRKSLTTSTSSREKSTN